ncbi:hypothetical protein [Salinimicrobium sediminilitoris]|uniref:hypothetical protein n=1 Tax=Salinimicrobium sediminilitoris TaxID=2876715 RepID=UPI001E51D2CB|nr:hypothetical protein [Salinimicrobium sediminilitoris]MCC8358493.1 hypothetical protein [Salinimicrobium sediminilitoris]
MTKLFYVMLNLFQHLPMELPSLLMYFRIYSGATAIKENLKQVQVDQVILRHAEFISASPFTSSRHSEFISKSIQVLL